MIYLILCVIEKCQIDAFVAVLDLAFDLYLAQDPFFFCFINSPLCNFFSLPEMKAQVSYLSGVVYDSIKLISFWLLLLR